MPPLSFNLDLDPELPVNIKKIAVEQGECEETRAQQIEEFRNFILEHEDFQPYRSDDAFLIPFLRSRYWKKQSSYKLLCNYCNFRDQNPSYFEKVRPQDLLPVVAANILQVTPLRDQTGRRIMILRFGAWKPNELTVDDIFRAAVCVFEMGSLEPITQVMGGIGIFDLEGFSLSHMLHLSPSVAKKIIALMVTSMPVRVSSIHIVNQNFIFKTALNIFKPFLNAKMREHLHIHGSNMESLHQHINAEFLPKRYGGTLEEFSNDLWINALMENKEVQIGLEKQGYVV